MILKCIDGPMGGAVYVLDRNEKNTNRKPDGLWFDRQTETGEWVQDQYGFDRLAAGGDHVTMIYRYGGSCDLMISDTLRKRAEENAFKALNAARDDAAYMQSMSDLAASGGIVDALYLSSLQIPPVDVVPEPTAEDLTWFHAAFAAQIGNPGESAVRDFRSFFRCLVSLVRRCRDAETKLAITEFRYRGRGEQIKALEAEIERLGKENDRVNELNAEIERLRNGCAINGFEPDRCMMRPDGERCGLKAGHEGKCRWRNGD